MSYRKITVYGVGKTDTFSNADAYENPSGSLKVTTPPRSANVVYAHGRWIKYTEEGHISNGK